MDQSTEEVRVPEAAIEAACKAFDGQLDGEIFTATYPESFMREAIIAALSAIERETRDRLEQFLNARESSYQVFAKQWKQDAPEGTLRYEDAGRATAYRDVLDNLDRLLRGPASDGRKEAE